VENVVPNYYRGARAHYGLLVSVGRLPLFVLSPKQCGKANWWFATLVNGSYYLIGKHGVESRDLARTESKRRWGHPAKELRADTKKAPKQKKTGVKVRDAA
jgi:hypothetical protein